MPVLRKTANRRSLSFATACLVLFALLFSRTTAYAAWSNQGSSGQVTYSSNGLPITVIEKATADLRKTAQSTGTDGAYTVQLDFQTMPQLEGMTTPEGATPWTNVVLVLDVSKEMNTKWDATKNAVHSMIDQMFYFDNRNTRMGIVLVDTEAYGLSLLRNNATDLKKELDDSTIHFGPDEVNLAAGINWAKNALGPDIQNNFIVVVSHGTQINDNKAIAAADSVNNAQIYTVGLDLNGTNLPDVATEDLLKKIGSFRSTVSNLLSDTLVAIANEINKGREHTITNHKELRITDPMSPYVEFRDSLQLLERDGNGNWIASPNATLTFHNNTVQCSFSNYSGGKPYRITYEVQIKPEYKGQRLHKADTLGSNPEPGTDGLVLNGKTTIETDLVSAREVPVPVGTLGAYVPGLGDTSKEEDPSNPGGDPSNPDGDPSRPGGDPSRPGGDPSIPGGDPSRPGLHDPSTGWGRPGNPDIPYVYDDDVSPRSTQAIDTTDKPRASTSPRTPKKKPPVSNADSYENCMVGHAVEFAANTATTSWSMGFGGIKTPYMRWFPPCKAK